MFLKRPNEPVGQRARWLDFIEQFALDLQHREGASHYNLSRRPCERQGDPCRQCSGRSDDREDSAVTREGILAEDQSLKVPRNAAQRAQELQSGSRWVSRQYDRDGMIILLSRLRCSRPRPRPRLWSSTTKTHKSEKQKHNSIHDWLKKIITDVIEWCAAMKMMTYWSRYNWSPFNDSTINTRQRLVNKALCRQRLNVRLHLLTLILWPKNNQKTKTKTLINESRDQDSSIENHSCGYDLAAVRSVTSLMFCKAWMKRFSTSSSKLIHSLARRSSASPHVNRVLLQTHSVKWSIEQSLTSHSTQFRSFRRRCFIGLMTQPTVSKHWRRVVSYPDRPQSNQAHLTMSQ